MPEASESEAPERNRQSIARRVPIEKCPQIFLSPRCHRSRAGNIRKHLLLPPKLQRDSNHSHRSHPNRESQILRRSSLSTWHGELGRQ